MSVRRGETKIDILYVTLQKRKEFNQAETSEYVYSITKDHVTSYGKPLIKMSVGTTYQFVIDTPGYPFYITTDTCGGGVLRKPALSYMGSIEITPENTEEKGNIGIEKGVLTWTPESAHSQMKLFYQSNYHNHAGNQINVVME